MGQLRGRELAYLHLSVRGARARREEEKPPTFGLFDSLEQLERLGNLQDQFRVWLYGHWLAEYGRMAKEIIGSVPVFVTSAGLGGPAQDYLQIHQYALLEGLDGLSRNHYAWVGRTEQGRLATFVPGSRMRFPLETVAEMLDSVQSQSGRTKAYWANEFGRPRREEDGFVDDFGLGHQFSFPSKEDLRDFLTVLIDNGYKGFNMFKMNPSVEAAREEVQWMAELKDEILRKATAEAHPVGNPLPWVKPRPPIIRRPRPRSDHHSQSFFRYSGRLLLLAVPGVPGAEP